MAVLLNLEVLKYAIITSKNFSEDIVKKTYSTLSAWFVMVGIILLLGYIVINIISSSFDALLYAAILLYIIGLILGFAARFKKERGNKKNLGIFLTVTLAITFFLWYFYKLIVLFFSNWLEASIMEALSL